MSKLAIIGAGIVGNLAAIYFRKRLPEVEVVLIGRTDRKRPIVGESTVELTTHFLEGLGLGALLEEKHYHKYGLSYYHKLSEDPACRRYVVHQVPGVIRMPAYNLNRNTFDRDINALNRQNGVHVLQADVTDVRLSESPGGMHHLTIQNTDGEQVELQADWVVDASGRNRFLSRKLKLSKPSPYQRSCFWFRLEKFDRACLLNMERTSQEHHCYDTYYVTHHFFGRGYWIWLIPMRSETGENLISIGITFRPEIAGKDISSMEEFLALMERDHPVIKELVESGMVVDTNMYRNYMYESQKYYSENGWFLIGDAAFPADPINSSGLTVVASQIPQVAAMVKKMMTGTLTSEYVQRMEGFIGLQLVAQDYFSKQYEYYHDPMKTAWIQFFGNLRFFHLLLPNYVNGGFLDGNQLRQTVEFFKKRVPPEMLGPAYPFPCLLDAIAESYSPGWPPPEYLPDLFQKTINWQLYKADEKARPKYVANYYWKLVGMRFTLLRMVKWKPSVKHLMLLCRHIKGGAADAMRSLALRLRPSLFYKYGPSPEPLASPFGPGGAFLHWGNHRAAVVHAEGMAGGPASEEQDDKWLAEIQA